MTPEEGLRQRTDVRVALVLGFVIGIVTSSLLVLTSMMFN